MKVKRIVHAVTVAALCAVAARAGERPVVCAQGPWEMSQATSPDVWMAAKVQGTVLGTLVANGKVPDPYYGLNNSIAEGRIPDLSADRRFYEATFRTRVALPADFADKVVWMRPEGINYRSEIYLNGRLAATTAGMFARNAVDVTSFVRPGEANDLLVKVWPVDHPGSIKPKKWGAAGEWHNGGDGEIGRNVTMLMSAGWDFTFNDGIRDRNTGIWKPITFFATDSVRLDAPYVRTKLNADFSAADLTLEVDLHNPGNGWGSEVKGTIVAEVEGTDVRFEKQVKLFRGERRTEFLSAKMGNPELWWPRNKGTQKLYETTIRFIEEGKGEPADAVRVRFGIRELTSGQRASDGARQFFVNRRPIFIRGTNWIPEAMLKTDDGRMEAEMRLTAQSGVNLVRLWAGGIVESDRFYELCDEYGLLVWQEFWMTGDTRHPDDPGLYLDNVRQQVKRIRSHACLAHWVASNESTEVEGTEELVKKLTGTTSWMMQSECDGVHDGSPYYPVNPMSYYEDTASDRGSRVYGFSPEYGTCALPPAECCRAFMPENLLWPIESNVAAWKYREGGGFDQLTEFHHAHVNGYGRSATFDDYARKSQAADALAHRALWETWNRARNHATGVLFWYNNTPIPQLGGHAWDYSLVSTASQFAQANALEPLHAQYEYLSNRVSIVSDVVGAHGLSVRAEVYDFDSRKVWERTAVAEVPGETCVDLFAIPFDSELRFDKPHFIKLRLFEKDEEIASTFYWRSTSRYEGPQTVTGPCVVGFEALEDLPRTRLTAREVSRARGRLTLEVGNAGDRVAFMTEVRVEGTDGKYLKPAFFSDNFFALLPGERKTVVVDHPDVAFRWRVKAWNATAKQGD